MSVSAASLPGSEAARSVGAESGRRWRSADSLLPAAGPLAPGCGAELAVTGPAGRLLAIGSCEHWQGAPDSLDLTWGAASRFELSVRVAGPAGPGVTDALDRLLAEWRGHLGSLPSFVAADTAAVIHWPSRDVSGPLALLRQRFAPLSVIAARTTPPGAHPAASGCTRAAASAGGVVSPGGAVSPGSAMSPRGAENLGDAGGPAGVRIRRAAPADLETLVRLGLEVIRFDAQFGDVQERPSTAAALTAEFAASLAEPQPWMWLAERGADPVGMLAAEKPGQAQWIAPMTGAGPVAYLLLMGVRAGERGSGVGAALAATLAAEVRAASVPVILLHYAQVNPLSVPFWSQQGYRPLWTCWEARPPAVPR
jgi:GNAT superfamily N-acetyltransferase